MNNTFDSKGGEQNIAQGKNATGKHENVTQEVRGDGNIFSGTGNVAVTYGMSPEDAAKLARELLWPQLEAKDEQIKALTEAVTALAKADAPAKSINEALQALEQGDTAKAQAIFAEVLRSKEAEGRQANKEAAAAARHLGALAFMNDTKAALAAYQKAVQLDPDDVDGWNQLGHLLHRTGELAQAEEAYRKVLALGEAHQDKEWQAKAYGNLGNVYLTRSNLGLVYDARGELDKAEEMYSKSLEISEALGLKAATANQYGNLGNVYFIRTNLGLVYDTRGELDKAEEMHQKSLEISKALGTKEATANNYAGLGIVYQARGELDKAEAMYRKALEISETLGLKEATARIYGNLGVVYKTRGELDKAEAAYSKSLSLYQEMEAMGHPDAKMVQQLLDELAQHRASQPAPPTASPRR
ncbi:tetratricopeptide repeat protein [Candidatus Electronema sp. TJ]|uniref:tetratricopeptide repeat protein n=1 Tax=Candidatus Electronema sp. TJ TaxID=3401573 RepID=UPI003AA93E16